MITNNSDTYEVQVMCNLIWAFTTLYCSLSRMLGLKRFYYLYWLVDDKLSTHLPEKAFSIKHIKDINSEWYPKKPVKLFIRIL